MPPAKDTAAISVALVGIGKIARDQHVPAITASAQWDLAATVSRSGCVPGVPAYTDLERLLVERPDISVVSLCLPPVPRLAYAQAALKAGRHVMLEKPPGATVAEVRALATLAARQGVSLFATWHSRMARAVEPARRWLAGRKVRSAEIIWREDVRHWHPGQDWVFEPGGLGVFDPGINALSILTHILPEPVHLIAAEIEVPVNRATPIAARLAFSGGVSADFDWRQTGPQTWDIAVTTDDGAMTLRMGGNMLEIDGVPVSGDASIMGEYPALYDRMARLIRDGVSDVDLDPLILVADAMLLARRRDTDPFHF